MLYDLKLINDYINGEDLEGYNVDELENNPLFMRSVIIVSNDKKIYNLCSETVKSNYEFVCFMIDRFKDDKGFIDKVAKFFLEHNSDDNLNTRIYVKMCEALKHYNNEPLYFEYKIKFMASIIDDINGVILYKRKHPEDNNIGYGFTVFEEENSDDVTVLNYYAEQLISYIVEENDGELSDLIHNNFKNADDVRKRGIITFMIDYLNRYDTHLANYVAIHPESLNTHRRQIETILTRWNSYLNTEEVFKYEIIKERVCEFLAENDYILSEEIYLYYIGRELGISDKIARYYGLDKKTFDMVYGDDTEFIRKMLSSDKFRFIYTNIKRIMIEVLYNVEPGQGEGKIIEVDFSKIRK